MSDRRGAVRANSAAMLRACSLALLAASFAAIVLAGCGAESTRFEVVFADRALRDASAAVEITLRAGDCATGELLWRRVVRRDEQPTELPPALSRGRAYCVEAIARDATCAVVASARAPSAD
ncbi:MAG: hypothetical protein M3Y87_36740, partial [Myxococcota bacterium]|nr:hypothetical protein [Myxococcota bacterium]